MTILQSLLLGAIQGITEFLPISSTAHLILAGKLMGIPDSEFLQTFDVAIQAGSALAVLLMFWKRILGSKAILTKVIIAFIPACVLGLALHEFIKSVLFNSTEIILIALSLGGLALILLEQKQKKPDSGSLESITNMQALSVGFFQCLALIPGVSRSAASIGGGLLLGLSRTVATEFSFMLAVPTLLAASALDLYKSGPSLLGPNLLTFGVGFVTAFITSILVIRWLLGYVRKNSFTMFGVYRIVIAGLLAMILL